MTQMCIYVRQREVESLQSAQQETTPDVVPEVAPLVAVAVTDATLTPYYTLKYIQKQHQLNSVISFFLAKKDASSK